jgi:hypothetical protein
MTYLSPCNSWNRARNSRNGEYPAKPDETVKDFVGAAGLEPFDLHSMGSSHNR